MFPESFPGGPLDERGLIYDALVDDGGDEHPASDQNGPASVDREPPSDEDPGEDVPAAFACLGCGTVTTAPEPPASCPACHRTPGDRRGGALFQPLD